MKAAEDQLTSKAGTKATPGMQHSIAGGCPARGIGWAPWRRPEVTDRERGLAGGTHNAPVPRPAPTLPPHTWLPPPGRGAATSTGPGGRQLPAAFPSLSFLRGVLPGGQRLRPARPARRPRLTAATANGPAGPAGSPAAAGSEGAGRAAPVRLSPVAAPRRAPGSFWSTAETRRAAPVAARACAVAAVSPGSTRPGRGRQAGCTAGRLFVHGYVKKGSKCSFLRAFIARWGLRSLCLPGYGQGGEPGELGGGRSSGDRGTGGARCRCLCCLSSALELEGLVVQPCIVQNSSTLRFHLERVT